MTAETLTAAEAASAMAERRLSSAELVAACLDRIERRDGTVRAWLSVDREGALAAARQMDAERAAGRVRGPLHGMPFGVKDVIDVAGQPGTHNSPLHLSRVPVDDAGCVALMRAGGAIPLGKTDTAEFAAAGGRNAATRNPHDTGRTPGGSSAGSGAAVADLHVPLAFGTQTGGSMMRPAAYCGVYALKPTWGEVSREGAKLYAASLDTIGWYGRSVADLSLVAGVLGIEAAAMPRPLAGLRIAVCRTPYVDKVSADGHAALDRAVRALEAAGATVVARELPSSLNALNDAKETIMRGEGRAAFLPHARLYGDRFSDGLRRQAEGPDVITRSVLKAAQDYGAHARLVFESHYRDVDAVLCPGATGEADRGLDSSGSSILSSLWTVLHVPVVGIPAGEGSSGLPLGVQLIGFRFADAALLAAAEAVAAVVDPWAGKVRVPG